jgi:hypothetical protein
MHQGRQIIAALDAKVSCLFRYCCETHANEETVVENE